MSGDEKDGESASPETRQEALQPGMAHGAWAARQGRLADVLEDLEDGYYEVDLGGNFTAVNQALCRMHGLERAELLGRNNRDYTEPEVAARMFETFNRVYRTGEPVKFFMYENIRPDGTAGVEEISVHLIRNEAGEPVGFRGITRDVTERQRNEAYEQARNRALENLARHAPLGTTLAEVLAGLHVQMPDSASAILTVGDDGQSLDLAASMGPAERYLEQFDTMRLCPEGLLLMPAAEAGEGAVVIGFSAEADVKTGRIGAEAGYRSRLAHPILSSEREMLGVLLVLWERDYLGDPREARWLQSATATAEIAISHHHLVSRLAYLSQRDALTGLLNRRSFIEESTRGLALARRRSWTPGLIFLDLDRFKPVNDTYGHQAGDRLLTVIAGRLQEVVRESDSLARLGGDEFAIFAADLGNAGAEHLAHRIQARLTAPIDIGIGHSIEVNASVGIALATSPEDSLDTLLADADRGMYEAKSAGGGWAWGRGGGT